LLKIQRISFNYPHSTAFRGLQKINFTIQKGEFFGIVGLSGSGKTTLLKCLYGLVDLTSGQITWDGEIITGPLENLIPGHPRMRLVSQDYYVLDNHTVEENIRDMLVGYAETYKKKRTQFILQLLELRALAKIKARDLSSGQKQRVAIARALTIIPEVLLLDEPFSNLDAVLSEKLFYYLRSEIKNLGTTVILVSHRADEVLRHADRMAVMDNGAIRQIGSVLKVYYEPRGHKLAGLLGVCNKMTYFENGKKITRLIRPDRIELSETNGLFRGEITGTSFNGKCYENLVTLENGEALVVYSANHYASGRPVYLTIKP